MNHDTPLVSIGIPTFNGAGTLVKCLESVLRQTYNNIEIIVSDNMSSDSTPEVCREFQYQDRRVKAYRQPKNIEGVENFKFVRKKAQGKFFMLLGDDDWIDPELIQLCLQFLEENPDYIAASGRTFYYRENGVNFEGIPLSVRSDDPGVRMLHSIAAVMDAGSFHGLYRVKPAIEIPYIEAWGCDYYFLCEAAYHGKIDTLWAVACHRIDNSHRQSIDARLRSGGIVNEQCLDPYGVIASTLFWRIASNRSVFKKLKDWDRLRIAAVAAEVVRQRWPITGEADLLKFATDLFAGQDLLTEYHALRTRIMSEWLKAFDHTNVKKWNHVAPILDIFVKLGFTGINANSAERQLLKNLVETAATVDDHEFKNEATKIMSLFI